MVLWLGPEEPLCVAGVSDGRGGSPRATPERWSVAAVSSGAPESPLPGKAVMLTVRGWGKWPGLPARCGSARAGLWFGCCRDPENRHCLLDRAALDIGDRPKPRRRVPRSP